MLILVTEITAVKLSKIVATVPTIGGSLVCKTARHCSVGSVPGSDTRHGEPSSAQAPTGGQLLV